MLVGMVFGGFFSVVFRMQAVPVSDMRMVRGFLVVAGFMVFGSLKMMSGRVSVVFRGLFVVFCLVF